MFALDLLRAELLLRQCDRHAVENVEFDDDSNKVTMLVTSLCHACNELESELAVTKTTAEQKSSFYTLRTRSKWLFAGYFLWRSRACRSLGESAEAKDEAVHFLLETIDSFTSLSSDRSCSLPTPHLVSPGRSESLWKELSVDNLSRYRNEIQAASVVSQVREQFQLSLIHI